MAIRHDLAIVQYNGRLSEQLEAGQSLLKTGSIKQTPR